MVATQLDALQRNDWPDTDAGVRAAFDFSKPRDAEQLLPGQVRARSAGSASVLVPYFAPRVATVPARQPCLAAGAAPTLHSNLHCLLTDMTCTVCRSSFATHTGIAIKCFY